MKPFWFTPEQLLDFLLDECGSILDVLPTSIWLGHFEFPSDLALKYFLWANERLGVKIER